MTGLCKKTVDLIRSNLARFGLTTWLDRHGYRRTWLEHYDYRVSFEPVDGFVFDSESEKLTDETGD